MQMFSPIESSQWIPADYRFVASIDPAFLNIQSVSARLHVSAHEYHEPGLGEGHWIGVVANEGWCAALVQYFVDGQTHGVQVQTMFVDGQPNLHQLNSVLEYFGISDAHVKWRHGDLVQ